MLFLGQSHNHKYSHSNILKKTKKERKERKEANSAEISKYWNCSSYTITFYFAFFFFRMSFFLFFKMGSILYWMLFLCCSYSFSERGFILIDLYPFNILLRFVRCLFFFFLPPLCVIEMFLVLLSLMLASIIFPSSKKIFTRYIPFNICK